MKNLRLTRTACHIAAVNKIDADTIKSTFEAGRVKDSNKVPGQKIIHKDNISLIGVDKDDNTFLVITMRVPRA